MNKELTFLRVIDDRGTEITLQLFLFESQKFEHLKRLIALWSEEYEGNPSHLFINNVEHFVHYNTNKGLLHDNE